MDDFDQIPFDDNDFADNPEPRCPCILLLDTSGSTSGKPISELNEGLRQFEQELKSDSLAAKRAEIAVVTFGPVRVVQDFTGAAHWTAPHLSASGATPMGAAIETATELLRHRKDAYRNNGVSFYRPWIFLFTDGGPTDSIENAIRIVHDGEAEKAFSFYAIGFEAADMKVLERIATRDPLKLKGLAFREFFRWLSTSMQARSRSAPGELIALPPPTGPNGWAVSD